MAASAQELGPKLVKERHASSLEVALTEISKHVKNALVVSNNTAKYEENTSGIPKSVEAAVQPTSAQELQQIVQICSHYKVPMYPISTGKNWGYGTSNPTTSDALILDLSKMNKIVDFDEELGVVTVEPGVTQQQLSDFLIASGYEFMVPTTGAGPQCSILGNALERGYGLTPGIDHFQAVTSLRAILADGTYFSSAHYECGAAATDKAYKWGVGPYLEGLFAQGNFGIVFQGSIVLAPRPKRIAMFLCELNNDSQLQAALKAIRALRGESASSFSGINIMNRRRVLSMLVPELAKQDVLTLEQELALGKKYSVPKWTITGAIYGNDITFRTSIRNLKVSLKPTKGKLKVISKKTVVRISCVSSFLPQVLANPIKKRIDLISAGLDILQGKPRADVLKLAYWRNDAQDYQERTNPAKDKCGLIWYSPIIPMKIDNVLEYTSMVERICLKHGVDPLITFTSISSTAFDSTVPILFNARNRTQVHNAHACYRELFEEGKTRGFIPYRMGVDYMELLTENKDSVFWSSVAKIKSALDPDDLLAPGRYCPKSIDN